MLFEPCQNISESESFPQQKARGLLVSELREIVTGNYARNVLDYGAVDDLEHIPALDGLARNLRTSKPAA